MKPCSVRLYLVVDHTKVWNRCLLFWRAGVQNSRETQASECTITPRSFIVPAFCSGGFMGGGGARRKLGMPLYSGGLLYGLAPLCGPWPRPPRQLFRGTNGRGVPLLITTPLCRSLRRGRSGLEGGRRISRRISRYFLFFVPAPYCAS